MKTVYTLSIVFIFTFLSFSQTIELTSFASGLTSPVEIVNTSVTNDGRLFVVEQAGVIKILNTDGSVNTTPFLDINGIVGSGGERGLLGLAFAPDYATTGRFYVNYTNNAGNTVIARYTVSADANIANTAGTILLTITQPFSNHNGGKIAFGPDGFLYISTGDGGSGGDPGNRSQSNTTLLGKILRIDVSGNLYSIPTDNPYANTQGLAEIYAIGLRNAWKLSFDRMTGDLWIADVGQNDFEEINKVENSGTPGDNYGWRCYEASSTFNTGGNCPAFSATVIPVAEYNHFTNTCTSITGGYVYRGTMYPEFIGKYFFADLCSQEIGILSNNGNSWDLAWQTPNITASWTSFGEDIDGELYAAGGNTIYKISDASLSVTETQIGSFELYPNPSNGEIIIDFGSNFLSIKTLSIKNSLGQQVHYLNIGSSRNITITTRSYKAGLYFVEIENNVGVKTIKKLIIN